jgi:hypothetical protein
VDTVDPREEAFREGFRAGVERTRSQMLDAIYAMRETEAVEDDAWLTSAARLEQEQERGR